jgi:cation transport ATPase
VAAGESDKKSKEEREWGKAKRSKEENRTAMDSALVAVVVVAVVVVLILLMVGVYYTRKIYREGYSESSRVLAMILLVVGLFFWPLLLGPPFIYWLGK